MKRILNIILNNPFAIAIQNISSVLEDDQKRRGVVMLFLLIINAFFDVFGLAIIQPLMVAAIEPMRIQTEVHIKFLYDLIGVEKVVPFLFILSAIVFLVFVFKNVFGIYISYLQASYSFNVALRLSLKQFQKYYNHGFLYIQDHDIGKKQYDVYQLPYQFASGYMIQSFIFMTEFTVVLMIFVIVLIVAPKALLILLLVIIPIFFVIYSITKKGVTEIGAERNRLFPYITKQINESMSAYPIVKLSNREQDFQNEYRDIQKRVNELDKLISGVYNKIPTRTNDVIFGLGIMLIFLTAIIFNNQQEEILSILSVFALAGYRFLPSMNKMLGATLRLKNLSYLKKEFEEIIDFKIKEYKKFERLRIKNEIRLDNISFIYPETNKYVINRLSLRVKKGETIGIIGESGSGKTTLLNLFLRLLKESEGSIFIDDQKLEGELNSRFQKSIGFVQQHVFIKDGTLIENIAFGESDPDINQVQYAVDKAMLKSFVESTSGGYKMKLGENGVKLSGGQRQRVGIARALYKKADVLIFDEATNALDMETEAAIKETIASLTNMDKIIFIVAHRITTLDSCDRILELENGSIKQELSYAELLEDKVLNRKK